MIMAGIGRFGPYLKHGAVYKSLAKDDDVLSIGLNRAVACWPSPRAPTAAAARPASRSGNHPADGAPVTLMKAATAPM